jgi:hypothetical protein
MMNGGIICRKPVVPLVVYDRLVVLPGVLLEEMVSKIRVPGFLPIEVIAYFPGNPILIGAITFPASLLKAKLQSKMC